MNKLLEKEFYFCSGHKIFFYVRIYEGAAYCPKCKKELFEYVYKKQAEDEEKRKRKEKKHGTV